MKKTVFLGTILLCGSIGLNLYMLYGKDKQDMSAQKRISPIAIMSPVSHPAIAEIEQGCIKTLQQSPAVEYRCSVFNANGNSSLMRSQADEVLHGNFDAVITIGVNATQTLKELTAKKQIFLPVVFCGIDETLSEELKNIQNITGVFDQPNYPEQLDLLYHLKPTTKNLLLVCSPAYGPSLLADIQLITELLQEKGIQLKEIHVSDINELQAKTAAFIGETDVLLILKDHIPVTGVDSLIKLCNAHGVTLYASDLNSGTKGAALAYGIREYDSGAYAAKKIRTIIEEKRQPSDVPISSVKHLKLKLNTSTMQQQGLDLHQNLIALIEHGCTTRQEEEQC